MWAQAHCAFTFFVDYRTAGITKDATGFGGSEEILGSEGGMGSEGEGEGNSCMGSEGEGKSCMGREGEKGEGEGKEVEEQLERICGWWCWVILIIGSVE